MVRRVCRLGRVFTVLLLVGILRLLLCLFMRSLRVFMSVIISLLIFILLRMEILILRRSLCPLVCVPMVCVRVRLVS